MAMTFEEYCEDFLDQHIGLMNQSERNEAYAGYKKLLQKSKTTTAKHPDSHLKVNELRLKIQRLIDGQKISIERNAEKDVSLARLFIRQATAALSGKTKKSELLELIDLNSDASRQINLQQ